MRSFLSQKNEQQLREQIKTALPPERERKVGMARPKTPWFPFWAAEYLTDLSVRSLNLMERGAFIEILCWMYNSPRRGVLLLQNSSVIPREFLTGQVLVPGIPWEDGWESAGQVGQKAEVILDRLLAVGLIKQGQNGAFFNKRLLLYLTEWELNNLKGNSLLEYMEFLSQYLNSSEIPQVFLRRSSAIPKANLTTEPEGEPEGEPELKTKTNTKLPGESPQKPAAITPAPFPNAPDSKTQKAVVKAMTEKLAEGMSMPTKPRPPRPRTLNQQMQDDWIKKAQACYSAVFNKHVAPGQVCLLAYGYRGSRRDCFGEIDILIKFWENCRGQTIEDPFTYSLACAKNPETVHRFLKMV